MDMDGLKLKPTPLAALQRSPGKFLNVTTRHAIISTTVRDTARRATISWPRPYRCAPHTRRCELLCSMQPSNIKIIAELTCCAPTAVIARARRRSQLQVQYASSVESVLGHEVIMLSAKLSALGILAAEHAVPKPADQAVPALQPLSRRSRVHPAGDALSAIRH
jgi:hypothetical protein